MLNINRFFKKDYEKKCVILQELNQYREARIQDELVEEVKNILKPKKNASSVRYRGGLPRLLEYIDRRIQEMKKEQQRIYVLDDDMIEPERIYKVEEIKKVCINYNLVFADAQYFKKQIPDTAEIKIEHLNQTYRKSLSSLKILSYRECFTNPNCSKNYGILFACTYNQNYYLIHQWGTPVSKTRKWLYWPLKRFENMAIFLLIFTLIVDLLLPTHLITLDRTATYWCGYRLGVFFHLFIFFSGFAVFIIMAFFKNFTQSNWDSI